MAHADAAFRNVTLLISQLEDRGDEVKDKDVKIEELKSEVLRQQADISRLA